MAFSWLVSEILQVLSVSLWILYPLSVFSYFLTIDYFISSQTNRTKNNTTTLGSLWVAVPIDGGRS